MEMSEKDFIELYGHLEVEFVEMDKFRAMYRNKENKIWCSGVVEYRSIIKKTETVRDIFDLEYFHFGFSEVTC